MSRFTSVFLSIMLSGLAVLILAMFLARVPASSGAPVDDSLQCAIEAEVCPDPSVVAEKVLVAESSRKQVIQDSIEESISVRESIEDSIQESIEESFSVEASLLASIEASEEASRIAEEQARQQSIAESIAASRAAETPNLPPASGNVILFGDSRTSGFSAYRCYPESAVLWSWDPIERHYDNLRRAAAATPEKIIFLNGIDDLISYGVVGSRDRYERAIQYFHSICPGTEIYVGSVIPCEMTVPGAAKYPVLAQIPEYNTLLIDMCARNGWTYIDGSAGFSEAFAFGTGSGRDGIHFTPAWTRQWLANLRLAAGF